MPIRIPNTVCIVEAVFNRVGFISLSKPFLKKYVVFGALDIELHNNHLRLAAAIYLPLPRHHPCKYTFRNRFIARHQCGILR